MKITGFILCAAIMISCTNIRSLNQEDFTTLWDSIRVLKNPGKGWYHHLLDNGIDKYKMENDSLFLYFPGMDHIYLRLAWNYLEPEEGVYNWQVIDTIIDKYIPLGFGISFRITSKETGRYPGSVNQEVNGIQYATPFWVRKAGAKGTVAEMWNIKSWVPVWDDPVYLHKLENFHRAFAERYDGKPWIRYIDIGSIGEWGEGHTSFSTKIPPSVDEIKANIDIFLKNYTKSQLVCTDDLIYYGKNEQDVNLLLDYVKSNGISLRDDSPLVEWYIKQNLNTWSVSHPAFYDPLYLKKPVVFELQHYGTVKKDGNWLGRNGADTIPAYKHSGREIMINAVKTLHASYIGYHGFAEEWLKDNPDLTNELANLCGYWYFPIEERHNKVFEKGENIISMKWLNKGVAPAYEDLNIVFRLEKPVNKPFKEFIINNSGNTGWMPGKVAEEEFVLNFDESIPAGKYILKFKLVNNSYDNPETIDLGLKKECFDNDGFIRLGTVRF